MVIKEYPNADLASRLREYVIKVDMPPSKVTHSDNRLYLKWNDHEYVAVFRDTEAGRFFDFHYENPYDGDLNKIRHLLNIKRYSTIITPLGAHEGTLKYKDGTETVTTDTVYFSTRIRSLPRGRGRKISPKFFEALHQGVIKSLVKAIEDY